MSESPYDDFAPDYHWIHPDDQVSGRRFFEHYGGLLSEVRARSAILDCACGAGFDAMALAEAGYQVAASDGSAGMVEHARASIAAAGLDIPVTCCTWEKLPVHYGPEFDAVLCLGNSIAHCADAAAMADAFAGMRAVLRPGGLLVVESRDWEQLHAERQRLEVRDHVAIRDGARGICVYIWTIPEGWDEPHRAEIVVLLDRDGELSHRVVELSFTPYREAELVDRLVRAGFEHRATGRLRKGRYVVSARRTADA